MTNETNTPTNESAEGLDELEALRSDLRLLKEKLEQEEILTEDMLIEPVLQERAELEKEVMHLYYLAPIILWPTALIYLGLSALPLWVTIVLGIVLYGMTIWGIRRTQRLRSDRQAFGLMGNSIAELEAYCHKKLRNHWRGYAWATILVPTFYILDKLVLFPEDDWEIVLRRIVFWLILSALLILPPMRKRRRRYQDILSHLEELRRTLRIERSEPRD